MGVLWPSLLPPQIHANPPPKTSSTEKAQRLQECPGVAVPWLALSPSTELMDGLGPGHGITVRIVHLDPIIANTHRICGHHSWGRREHTHTAGRSVSWTSKDRKSVV